MAVKKTQTRTRVTQVLPSYRIIPNIELSQKLQDELIEIAEAALAHNRRAEFDQNPIGAFLAPSKAERAIAWLVSERHYEMSLPDFRMEVDASKKDSLAYSVLQLLNRLPGDAKPPLAQMKSLYCYNDAQSNGLRSKDTSNELSEKQRREQRWDAELSARSVRAALEQWLELLAELKVQSGSGRTNISAQIPFVKQLAHYWQSELKLPLGNSRAQGNRPAGQNGFFSKFVLKAAEGIPHEFRGGNRWDHAIREGSKTAEKTAS